MFLYDNMIKAELQTEDGFMIVSIKQEPLPIRHVKTEPEDIENYASHLQNTKQIEVKRDNDVKNEHEDSNLDRCNVCKKMLTVNQSHETVGECIPKYPGCGSSTLIDPDRKTDYRQTDSSQSACNTENMNSSAAKRNPFRSAKGNVVYRENDFETTADSNKDGSLIIDYFTSCVEGQAVTMDFIITDNQSEPDLIGQQQSGEPSVKEKWFKCEICDKKFTRNGNLKHHIKTVHDKIRAFPCPFKCNICEKTFTQSGHLTQHIKTVHSDKIRAFQCPRCPYKATQNGNLKNHLLTHTGEKNFQCDICEKKFTQNSHLKQHIKTVHDKIRAFPCPRCPYKATQNGDLKVHLRTHTGEKEFECPNCPYKATTNGHLKVHLRTHTREKEFECPNCPYKATINGNLKRHLLTHTGEKNFKCNICEKRFTHNSSLKRHTRTVHDLFD